MLNSSTMKEIREVDFHKIQQLVCQIEMLRLLVQYKKYIIFI